MYSRDQLAESFRTLGVGATDTVMMHASVRAVGEIAGGPDQIHLALKQVLTPAGSLIMYAGCPFGYDDVGRGHLSSAEESEILEKLPFFDPLTARAARDHGTLVEFFRTWPASRVNHHVARFVVWGRHAEHLISPQPWNYAYGLGSLLDRFLKLDGRILLLGCNHDTVTFLHYAEHIAEIPDKRVVRFQVPIQEGMRRVWRQMEEFDTSERAHANWPDCFFAKLVDAYLLSRRNRGALVGNAPSYLFRAGELLDFALPWMKAVAADRRAADNLAELSVRNTNIK